jgi:hypothetical protein
MNLAGRINDMGRSAALLSAWVIIASAGELVRSAGSLGETYGITRALLALVGLAAAALLWSGRNAGRDGLYLVMAWAALQVPFFATEPDGNYTRQLIDILLGMTDQVTVNGEVTSYTAFGLNLTGVILLGWAYSLRERIDLWRRRTEPART